MCPAKRLVSKGALYKLFLQWAQASREKPATDAVFGKQLGALGVQGERLTFKRRRVQCYALSEPACTDDELAELVKLKRRRPALPEAQEAPPPPSAPSGPFDSSAIVI